LLKGDDAVCQLQLEVDCQGQKKIFSFLCQGQAPKTFIELLGAALSTLPPTVLDLLFPTDQSRNRLGIGVLSLEKEVYLAMLEKNPLAQYARLRDVGRKHGVYQADTHHLILAEGLCLGMTERQVFDIISHELFHAVDDFLIQLPGQKYDLTFFSDDLTRFIAIHRSGLVQQVFQEAKGQVENKKQDQNFGTDPIGKYFVSRYASGFGFDTAPNIKAKEFLAESWVLGRILKKVDPVLENALENLKTQLQSGEVLLSSMQEGLVENLGFEYRKICGLGLWLHGSLNDDDLKKMEAAVHGMDQDSLAEYLALGEPKIKAPIVMFQAKASAVPAFLNESSTVPFFRCPGVFQLAKDFQVAWVSRVLQKQIEGRIDRAK